MKVVSQTYKDNIKKLGKQIDSIITYEIDGVQYELGVEQLNSVTPHYEGNILKSVMKQLDLVSKVDIPVGTTINYQFGLKVDDEEVQDYRDNYEYVDLGNYIVYSSEKQEADETFKLICYDKMLNSMKDYESMNITYPITIRNYLSAICTILGLTFGSINQNFVNYDKQITSELYLDTNGNSLNYTFRDVLDDLAQVTASTICINNNDELEIRYINDTQDTIDEEYLKDINVNFGEKYGAINTISFKRSADSDVISKSIPSDLSDDLKKEISISDNQILNQDNRADYLDGVLNQLYGLEYYINDFTSTGITFYNLCDKYNVSITRGSSSTTTYPCIMFNDEIEVTQGLQENVHTDMPDESITDYNRTTKDDRELSRASLIVDKVNGEVTSKVGKDEIISTINQSAEQVQIDASKISLTGKTIALTGDNINITGNNFSVDTSGNMTATSGTIGGFHIESDRLWNKVRVRDYSMEDVRGAATYVISWSRMSPSEQQEFLEYYGFSSQAEMIAKWDVNNSGDVTLGDVMNILTNYVDYSASGISLVAGANNTPGSIQLSGPYSDEAVTISADGSITLNKILTSNNYEERTLKISAESVEGDVTLNGDLTVTGNTKINTLNSQTVVNADGSIKSPNGFLSQGEGNVGTQTGGGYLVLKRANSSEAPNNGIVLEYGAYSGWGGQLYIGDNADQGIYYNGWSNGTRGTWKKLAWEPVSLYDNSSGSNASITLSETSSNFAYLEIFYRTNDDYRSSKKIYSPNGKKVILDASIISGNYTYVKSAQYSISGTSISLESNLSGQARIGNNVSTTWNRDSNRLYIEKVIGYRW